MVDWQLKIRNTRSEAELVALCREYLAAWYHGDLAQIAPECRPCRIRDVDDILYWSERLAEGFCANAVHAERPDRHREMLTFFMESARRAEELPCTKSSSTLEESGARVHER